MMQECFFFYPFFVNKDIKPKEQENKRTHQKIQRHQDHDFRGISTPGKLYYNTSLIFLCSVPGKSVCYIF